MLVKKLLRGFLETCFVLKFLPFRDDLFFPPGFLSKSMNKGVQGFYCMHFFPPSCWGCRIDKQLVLIQGMSYFGSRLERVFLMAVASGC